LRYRGSALEASVGLNATLTCYNDNMDFGFVANAAAIDGPTELAAPHAACLSGTVGGGGEAATARVFLNCRKQLVLA
jgi:hypothetical protein